MNDPEIINQLPPEPPTPLTIGEIVTRIVERLIAEEIEFDIHDDTVVSRHIGVNIGFKEGVARIYGRQIDIEVGLPNAMDLLKQLQFAEARREVVRLRDIAMGGVIARPSEERVELLTRIANALDSIAGGR